MTGRGKKISETKRPHLRTPDDKTHVPEDPCPDDEIYINSPQNNTSGPQIEKSQNVSRQARSKPIIAQQQNLDVDLESKEDSYSSLNLAQKDSVDVYEAHVTTVAGTESTFIIQEPFKETNLTLEETLLPSKQEASDGLKPNNVHFTKKYRKQILLLVGIVFIAVMASIFGGLIVGSAMSSMVADIMQSKCESTTTTTSNTDRNTTMDSTTETTATTVNQDG